jgi:NADPH:quinone reductase-like Zn-dependent oxidoreductase
VKNLGADHVANYEEAGWAATIKDKVGEKGIQVYLDSIGDLATEALPLLGQFAQWSSLVFARARIMRFPLNPPSPW